MTVVPGETLNLSVGGNGVNGTALPAGRGGGGTSWIATSSNVPKVVAAGGGGASWGLNRGVIGGNVGSGGGTNGSYSGGKPGNYPVPTSPGGYSDNGGRGTTGYGNGGYGGYLTEVGVVTTLASAGSTDSNGGGGGFNQSGGRPLRQIKAQAFNAWAFFVLLPLS